VSILDAGAITRGCSLRYLRLRAAPFQGSIDRITKFYTKGLGMKRLFQAETPTAVFLVVGTDRPGSLSLRFEMSKLGDFPAPAPVPDPSRSFRLVLHVKDVRAVTRSLEGAGFTPWVPPQPFLHAVWGAVFKDPSGIRVYLTEHTASSQAAPPDSEVVTIGYGVAMVADLSESIAYYSDCLGLAVVDEESNVGDRSKMVWMGNGPRPAFGCLCLKERYFPGATRAEKLFKEPDDPFLGIGLSHETPSAMARALVALRPTLMPPNLPDIGLKAKGFGTIVRLTDPNDLPVEISQWGLAAMAKELSEASMVGEAESLMQSPASAGRLAVMARQGSHLAIPPHLRKLGRSSTGGF
jgi:catechol 2,3-dioxygenase-like lactoylglutathione lyase family enzyme